MNLFNEDSMTGQIFRFLGDLILLNILWIVCSLPLITIGASTTALYYAVLKLHKEGEVSPVKAFFRSFRQNLFQSTAAWAGAAAIGFVLFLSGKWLLGAGGAGSLSLSCALAGVGILWAVFVLYVFPVLAAFSNRLSALAGHAFYFALHKPLYLLAVLCITCAPMYFTLVDAALFPVYLFLWLMFGFSLTAYGNAWFFLRLFTPYLPDAAAKAGERFTNDRGGFRNKKEEEKIDGNYL